MMAKSPNSYEELPAVAVTNTTPVELIAQAKHSGLGTRILGYYVTAPAGAAIAIGSGPGMTAAGSPFQIPAGGQMWIPMTGQLWGCRASGTGSVDILAAVGVG